MARREHAVLIRVEVHLLELEVGLHTVDESYIFWEAHSQVERVAVLQVSKYLPVLRQETRFEFRYIMYHRLAVLIDISMLRPVDIKLQGLHLVEQLRYGRLLRHSLDQSGVHDGVVLRLPVLHLHALLLVVDHDGSREVLTLLTRTVEFVAKASRLLSLSELLLNFLRGLLLFLQLSRQVADHRLQLIVAEVFDGVRCDCDSALSHACNFLCCLRHLIVCHKIHKTLKCGCFFGLWFLK